MMIIPNIHELEMSDITVFTRENNLVPVFKEKWGDQYFINAREKWKSFRESFYQETPLFLSLDELLFLLYYDFAIGGHAKDNGNPLPFYKWVFEQIKLADETENS